MSKLRQNISGFVPQDHLTGTLTGRRLMVILDDIKIGDKWNARTLDRLHADGLGVKEEQPLGFQFRDGLKSTIRFTKSGDGAEILVSQFLTFQVSKPDAQEPEKDTDPSETDEVANNDSDTKSV